MQNLLPNAIAPVIVLLALDIGGMVVMQAAFAFILEDGVNLTLNPHEVARRRFQRRRYLHTSVVGL